jgi:hypothetical protein
LLPSDIKSDSDKSALLHSQFALGLLNLFDAIFFRIRENPGRLLRRPLDAYLTFAKAIEPTVVELVQLAAANHGLQALFLHCDLACLLQHWSQERLFTNRIRLHLRDIARKAYTTYLDWIQSTHPLYYGRLITSTSSDNTENGVPSTHGLPEDAWYDLPVGTMVHAMTTTKPGHPVKTSRVKALNMPDGSIDPDMMDTVLQHIDECKGINAIPNMSTAADEKEFVLNGLGLRLSRDSLNNQDRPKYKVVEGYYGFSVPFMKIFQNIEKNPAAGPERPQNWMPPPPPPPELVQPPPFHTGYTPSLPPPTRDVQHMAGGNFRQNDFNRGNNAAWRGEEMHNSRGGAVNWRGRGRGWDRGSGGGHRPY